MKCSTSTIGRLVAIAPRVAKITDSTVAASMRASTPMPPAIVVRAMVRMRSIQAAMIVEARAGDAARSAPCAAAQDRRRPDGSLTTIMRGTGRSSSDKPAAEPRLEQARGLLLRIGAHVADAGDGAGDLDGRAPRRRRDRGPAPGRTWMVTSRATSDCHSLAARPHQHHRAGGERGEERHDGDDRDQRTAGDRALRARSACRRAAAAIALRRHQFADRPKVGAHGRSWAQS